MSVLDSPDLDALPDPPAQQRSAIRRYFSKPRLPVEIVILGLLYAFYSWIRNQVQAGEVRDEAFRNGRWLLKWEDNWHIALERPLNDLVHTTGWLADIVALHYASLHFIVTPAVLIWLFVKRKSVYRRVSSALIVTTGLALFGFHFMPTAPPRMLTSDGFVDVMAQTASWGWWPESGTPGSDAISNPYAAMPSLHCAWATWCGISLFLYARTRLVRILGLLYPLTTYFVVMGSGNHYLLDVLAGLLVLAIGAAVSEGVRALWLRLSS